MFTISFSYKVSINTELKSSIYVMTFLNKNLEISFQVTRSSISKLYHLFFLFSTIYEWLSIEIHVYHDAAPELAQVPVLWLESYCGLSDGRSDDFVVFTTIYL